MKLSIITPTNDFKYIKSLYDSIISQTYNDWEWILYVNGSAAHGAIPVYLTSDERIKITKSYEKNDKVGYLKNKAFNLGTGEVLVEVDHDDILISTCLEKLNEIYEKYPDVGFVHSDDARLADEGDKFAPYSPIYGWKSYEYEYNGKKLPVMSAFDQDAGSMAFIWYEPNHVRSWRTTVYKSIGGHNVDLAVLDDQDLLIRTYLVTKFYHINEPLYIYHLHLTNTFKKADLNKNIQIDTVKMYHKYAYQLAERDAELNGLLKVDIGGGKNGKAGYITIDKENGNMSANLDNGIPLPDNSVGVLNASHIIEHLKDKQKTMSEIYRVLADGGWAMITVPSTDGRGAFQDPTHVSYWNQNSFWYYTRKEQADFINNTKIKFQEFRLDTVFLSKWWQDNNIPCTVAWLRAIKSNKRRAGEIKI